MHGSIVRCARISVAVIALAALPAFAADAPKVNSKVLLDNDKVQVIENHFAPGAENANVPRGARVVRALTAGTLQRIYPDGKKENVEWKAGEVKYLPAVQGATPQYVTRNVGKAELVLYLVVLK